MVHALREVWRVLKLNSMVIDIRPTSEQVYIGWLHADGFIPIAEPEEDFEDYLAAEAALARATESRLFDHVSTRKFSLNTTFPSLESFREWFQDFYSSMPIASSEKLVKVVEGAVEGEATPAKLVAVVPFILSVLKKHVGD